MLMVLYINWNKPREADTDSTTYQSRSYYRQKGAIEKNKKTIALRVFYVISTMKSLGAVALYDIIIWKAFDSIAIVFFTEYSNQKKLSTRQITDFFPSWEALVARSNRIRILIWTNDVTFGEKLSSNFRNISVPACRAGISVLECLVFWHVNKIYTDKSCTVLRRYFVRHTVFI